MKLSEADSDDLQAIGRALGRALAMLGLDDPVRLQSLADLMGPGLEAEGAAHNQVCLGIADGITHVLDARRRSVS